MSDRPGPSKERAESPDVELVWENDIFIALRNSRILNYAPNASFDDDVQIVDIVPPVAGSSGLQPARSEFSPQRCQKRPMLASQSKEENNERILREEPLATDQQTDASVSVSQIKKRRIQNEEPEKQDLERAEIKTSLEIQQNAEAGTLNSSSSVVKPENCIAVQDSDSPSPELMEPHYMDELIKLFRQRRAISSETQSGATTNNTPTSPQKQPDTTETSTAADSNLGETSAEVQSTGKSSEPLVLMSTPGPSGSQNPSSQQNDTQYCRGTGSSTSSETAENNPINPEMELHGAPNCPDSAPIENNPDRNQNIMQSPVPQYSPSAETVKADDTEDDSSSTSSSSSRDSDLTEFDSNDDEMENEQETPETPPPPYTPRLCNSNSIQHQVERSPPPPYSPRAEVEDIEQSDSDTSTSSSSQGSPASPSSSRSGDGELEEKNDENEDDDSASTDSQQSDQEQDAEIVSNHSQGNEEEPASPHSPNSHQNVNPHAPLETSNDEDEASPKQEIPKTPESTDDEDQEIVNESSPQRNADDLVSQHSDDTNHDMGSPSPQSNMQPEGRSEASTSYDESNRPNDPVASASNSNAESKETSGESSSDEPKDTEPQTTVSTLKSILGQQSRRSPFEDQFTPSHFETLRDSPPSPSRYEESTESNPPENASVSSSLPNEQLGIQLLSQSTPESIQKHRGTTIMELSFSSGPDSIDLEASNLLPERNNTTADLPVLGDLSDILEYAAFSEEEGMTLRNDGSPEIKALSSRIEANAGASSPLPLNSSKSFETTLNTTFVNVTTRVLARDNIGLIRVPLSFQEHSSSSALPILGDVSAVPDNVSNIDRPIDVRQSFGHISNSHQPISELPDLGDISDVLDRTPLARKISSINRQHFTSADELSAGTIHYESRDWNITTPSVNFRVGNISSGEPHPRRTLTPRHPTPVNISDLRHALTSRCNYNRGTEIRHGSRIIYIPETVAEDTALPNSNSRISNDSSHYTFHCRLCALCHAAQISTDIFVPPRISSSGVGDFCYYPYVHQQTGLQSWHPQVFRNWLPQHYSSWEQPVDYWQHLPHNSVQVVLPWQPQLTPWQFQYLHWFQQLNPWQQRFHNYWLHHMPQWHHPFYYYPYMLNMGGPCGFYAHNVFDYTPHFGVVRRHHVPPPISELCNEQPLQVELSRSHIHYSRSLIPTYRMFVHAHGCYQEACVLMPSVISPEAIRLICGRAKQILQHAVHCKNRACPVVDCRRFQVFLVHILECFYGSCSVCNSLQIQLSLPRQVRFCAMQNCSLCEILLRLERVREYSRYTPSSDDESSSDDE